MPESDNRTRQLKQTKIKSLENLKTNKLNFNGNLRCKTEEKKNIKLCEQTSPKH